MDIRQLTVLFETPFMTYTGPFPVRDVVLAGLRYPTDYWVTLALAWLEQGAEVDHEIIERRHDIALASRQYEQRMRHRASRLAKTLGAGARY